MFQGFRPVAGTICPSRAAAVVGPSRAPQGMKKGRRPRRRPRLKLSDKAGPDQCPVPGENALFPAQIVGFLAVSRAVPVYPVFLNYVVPVHLSLSVGSLICRIKSCNNATVSTSFFCDRLFLYVKINAALLTESRHLCCAFIVKVPLSFIGVCCLAVIRSAEDDPVGKCYSFQDFV